MANDNYVVRERYNGLSLVDGQLIPQRGTVDDDELVASQPDDESAHNNGGGVVERPRRTRRNKAED